ncbi:noggin-2-like [Bacillus rossius redtenbacheri]|uniref:noggin-2-like n=1 Tax=Bacillus rossius redtenbacheri TaxID=93214 RepID=UPI002FDDFCA2
MEPLCWRILVLLAAWLLASPSSLCSPAANYNVSAGSGGLSPQESGLRPGPPLEDLPPPDLIEVPNKHHDPRQADLNATLLLARLGRNFDPRFMSIDKPRHQRHHANRTDSDDFPYRHNTKGRLVPKGQMPRALRKMNFKYIRLHDGTRVRTGVSAKLKKKLQQFLWAYTACPVAHRWRDLGVRFWPRYLREGYCPPSKTSCSIPPGMTCRPAAEAHKTVLRWHCPAGHRGGQHSAASSCQWINVEYPLVTQCSCSCPGNDSSS